jgi:predicted enzyme related to lactoylglutathione lyase
VVHSFCWFELRTDDVSAARAFYSEVLGLEIVEEQSALLVSLGGQRIGAITTLPERVKAQGAPSHWLGHLAVRSVEECVAEFVKRGGTQLGPLQHAADGVPFVIVRDPLGVIVALTSREAPRTPTGMAWHELHSRDHQQSFAMYAKLFGWQRREVLELGGELGSYQLFAWQESLPSVGGMSSGARLPHIHPQWAFYFPIRKLDQALTQIAARGGRVHTPVTVPSGARVVHCEDPQGAAFALYEAT